MALLWSQTTSIILLNGEVGTPIKHGRGLRQGDPLLLMLFILTMDPLQKLLDIATERGLLTPIGADPIKMRTSVYADDAVLFLRSIAADVTNLSNLLQFFGKATGLLTNITKSKVFPIRCEDADIRGMMGQFEAKVNSLPCKYLGLTLRTGRLCRADEQTLIDKVARKLPAWKGKLLNKAGRLALVNSVLSSDVLHHMTVFSLSKWAIKRIDKIRRQFLWRGAEEQRHGHCLVNWKRV
jgi:hypothetical protein